MLYTISRYSPEILQRVCMREDRYSLCNEGVCSYFTINIARQTQMEGKIQISSDYRYNVTLFCVFLPQIEWQYDNTQNSCLTDRQAQCRSRFSIGMQPRQVWDYNLTFYSSHEYQCRLQFLLSIMMNSSTVPTTLLVLPWETLTVTGSEACYTASYL